MAGKHSKKKESPLREKIRELRAGLRRKEREYKEIKELLQRVQAEFENAMKRKEREIALKEKKARATVLLEFLPVLDSAEGALKHSRDSGLRQLHSQLLQAFRKSGVSEVPAGGRFNPNTMECMMRVNKPGKENNSVLEVFQKGYMFKSSVLRPAKVKINVFEEKGETEKEKKT